MLAIHSASLLSLQGIAIPAERPAPQVGAGSYRSVSGHLGLSRSAPPLLAYASALCSRVFPPLLGGHLPGRYADSLPLGAVPLLLPVSPQLAGVAVRYSWGVPPVPLYHTSSSRL